MSTGDATAQIFLALPDEMWTHHIVCSFDNKTLSAFKMTCKRFYNWFHCEIVRNYRLHLLVNKYKHCVGLGMYFEMISNYDTNAMDFMIVHNGPQLKSLFSKPHSQMKNFDKDLQFFLAHLRMRNFYMPIDLTIFSMAILQAEHIVLFLLDHMMQIDPQETIDELFIPIICYVAMTNNTTLLENIRSKYENCVRRNELTQIIFTHSQFLSQNMTTNLRSWILLLNK